MTIMPTIPLDVFHVATRSAEGTTPAFATLHRGEDGPEDCWGAVWGGRASPYEQSDVNACAAWDRNPPEDP